MDLNRIPLFAALTRKLEWLGDRQRVLSQNVANADTPGYQANDLKPLSFRALVGGTIATNGGRMTSTDNRHLVGTAGHGNFATQRSRDSFEVTPSGNGVVLEQQIAKMADNQMQFAASTGLYKKHINMLRMALGRRGGM